MMTVNRIKQVSLIIVLTITLSVMFGCERYIDSRDPVRSLPDDSLIPTDLAVEVNNQTVTLSWDIDNPSAVSQYRVYIAKEGDSLFVLRDSTTATSIELVGLTVNQRYLFRVAAVSKTNLEWNQSEIVSAVITYLSIDLAGGNLYTNSRNIQVRINAPTSTSHIMLSEDSLFTEAEFVPFVGTSTNFELSEGDGAKFVFARLQFADGSITGEPLSDSVILDTRAKIDSVFFQIPDNGQFFVTGEKITFGMNTGETGGRRAVALITGSAITLYDDGTNADPDSGNGIYYGTWTVPVQFILNAGDVTGEFTDAAGNTASPVKANRAINIFTAPQPVTLSATPLSTFEIALSWPRSTSGNFASYRLYRDNTDVVSETSTLLEVFPSAGATSYTDTTLNDDQTYYYRLYVYDQVGQSSASRIASAHTLVNTAPTPVELTVVVDSPTVDLTWTASEERDFESYRIYRGDENVDSTSSLVLLERRQNVTSADNIDLQGSTYLRIYVFDRHGLSAAGAPVRVQ